MLQPIPADQAGPPRHPRVARTAPATHARRAALGAVLLLFAAPLPLHAQLGKLARKAASKAANQAVGMSGVTAESPTFDHTVLELDEGRITAVIAGLQAAASATGPGGATRERLLQQASAANERRNALLDNRDNELRRFDEETRRVNMCTSAVLDSLHQVQNTAMQKKAAQLAASPDPMNTKLMQDVMQMTAELQRLAAAGDTAGAVALQRALARKYGIDPARDSLYATTLCGAQPQKASWHREADSLLVVSNTAMRQAQALDEQAAEGAARAAGMTTQQFAVARERVEAYVGANGNPSSSWRFSVTERKALLPRLQQLKGML